MFRIIIFLVLAMNSGTLEGQEKVDTIAIQHSIFGPYYKYHDRVISSEGFHILLYNVPAANVELNKSEKYKGLLSVMGPVCLGLLIWAVAPDTPDDTETALAITGSVILVASIPLISYKVRHEKKAVLMYNHHILENREP